MDRFRDLEGAGDTGRKDVALLAAIAGFEGLKHPTAHDIRQFSNLFIGLYTLTSEDTRRTAAAALSRIHGLPQEVAMIVADQPIRISAPFLALSPSISDPVLLQTISRHGGAHARAISRRDTLTPRVKEALTELDDAAVARSMRLRHDRGARVPALSPEALAKRRQDDDALRNRIKDMALARIRRSENAESIPVETGRPDISQLVKFAKASQSERFSKLLARALGSDLDLAERILLDSSGTQLAMALQTLNLSDTEILRVLVGIYPPLGEYSGDDQHATLVLKSFSRAQSARKVAAWVRANAVESRDDRAVYEPQNSNATQRTGRSQTGLHTSRVSKPMNTEKRVRRA